VARLNAIKAKADIPSVELAYAHRTASKTVEVIICNNSTVICDMTVRAVIVRLGFDSSKLFENGLVRVELYAKKMVKLIQIIAQKIKIHVCKNCFQVGLRGEEA